MTNTELITNTAHSRSQYTIRHNRPWVSIVSKESVWLINTSNVISITYGGCDLYVYLIGGEALRIPVVPISDTDPTIGTEDQFCKGMADVAAFEARRLTYALLGEDSTKKLLG